MTLWYLARAGGLSAMVLVTVATALGALASVRSHAVGRRVVLQYLHRAAAALGLTLLVVHIGAVVLDAQSHVPLRAVVLPLTSSYRPVALALGTTALYLLLAVSIAGAARGRLAPSWRAVRLWRGVHAGAYGAWALGVLHGFLAGTDAGLGWVRVLDLASVAVVLAAIAVRLGRAPQPRRAGRLLAVARS